MGLKPIFLIVSRAVSLLRLSRRESWWKDAEILILRHQLTVAERERPTARARLTWPDRAFLALLVGMLQSIGSLRCGSSSLQAPSCDGITTSCAAGGRAGQPNAVPGALARTARSDRWCCGWPVRTNPGGTGRSTASWPGSASWWHLPRSGRSSRTSGSVQRRAGTAPAGPNSCDLNAGDPGTGLLRHRPAQRHKGLRPSRDRAWHPPDRVLGSTEHPVQAWVVQQA